jgi:hypothetical protein
MTGGAGQSSPLQGAETASGQKHPQSQIDVLTWSMWLAPHGAPQQSSKRGADTAWEGPCAMRPEFKADPSGLGAHLTFQLTET